MHEKPRWFQAASRRLPNTATSKSTKTTTHRQSRAIALATVAFATLVFTTAPASTRESWPQRIPLERDWLLAAEVAAQDQLDGLATTKADAAGGCDRLAPLVSRG